MNNSNGSIVLSDRSVAGESSNMSESPAFKAVLVFICIIVIGATIANGLMCYVILRSKEHLHQSDYFIASIAASDLLMCLIVFPFTIIHDVQQEWKFGQVFCKVWTFLDLAMGAVSIYSMTLICINACFHSRYMFVKLYLFTKLHTPRVIAISWAIAIVSTAIPLVINVPDLKQTAAQSGSYVCMFDESLEAAVFSTVITFIVPCLVCFCLYITVVTSKDKDSDKNHKRMSIAFNGRKGSSFEGEPYGLFTMTDKEYGILSLGIKLCIYFLCWMPFFVVRILSRSCNKCVQPPVNAIVIWLTYVNSWITPVVYGVLNKRVHDRLINLCSCKTDESTFSRRQSLGSCSGDSLKMLTEMQVDVICPPAPVTSTSIMDTMYDYGSETDPPGLVGSSLQKNRHQRDSPSSKHSDVDMNLLSTSEGNTISHNSSPNSEHVLYLKFSPEKDERLCGQVIVRSFSVMRSPEADRPPQQNLDYTHVPDATNASRFPPRKPKRRMPLPAHNPSDDLSSRLEGNEPTFTEEAESVKSESLSPSSSMAQQKPTNVFLRAHDSSGCRQYTTSKSSESSKSAAYETHLNDATYHPHEVRDMDIDATSKSPICGIHQQAFTVGPYQLSHVDLQQRMKASQKQSKNEYEPQCSYRGRERSDTFPGTAELASPTISTTKEPDINPLTLRVYPRSPSAFSASGDAEATAEDDFNTYKDAFDCKANPCFHKQCRLHSKLASPLLTNLGPSSSIKPAARIEESLSEEEVFSSGTENTDKTSGGSDSTGAFEEVSSHTPAYETASSDEFELSRSKTSVNTKDSYSQAHSAEAETSNSSSDSHEATSSIKTAPDTGSEDAESTSKTDQSSSNTSGSSSSAFEAHPEGLLADYLLPSGGEELSTSHETIEDVQLAPRASMTPSSHSPGMSPKTHSRPTGAHVPLHSVRMDAIHLSPTSSSIKEWRSPKITAAIEKLNSRK